MVLPNEIPQESVFFVEPWTKELEEYTIRKMATELLDGNWIRGNKENNKRVMKNVRLDVKDELGIDIPIEEYLAKLVQLEGRFKNFSKLIGRNDVVFSDTHNTVRASPETWWDIAETDPDCLVYMRSGEASWHYIKDLFVEVVEISDSSAHAARNRGDNLEVRSGSSRSTGRHNQRPRAVIQISSTSEEDNIDFPRALYVSSSSTSLPPYQSSESRSESGIVDQSSYSLGSPSFPGPSSDSY